MPQVFCQMRSTLLLRVVGFLLSACGMCGSTGASAADPNGPGVMVAQAQAPNYQAATPVPARYLGCFKDEGDRDLQGKFWEDGHMTPERCLQSCSDAGYAYAGVQYASQCFCGNSHGRYGRLNESSCNMRCSGDSRLVCGGTWANTLYKTASWRETPPMVAPPPPPPPERSSYVAPAATYLGCFRDTEPRDLNASNWEDGQMTPARCIRSCTERGAEYAGLQYGSQCFCGNSHGRYGRIDASSCNMPCSGNTGLMCGGTWANSVFRLR